MPNSSTAKDLTAGTVGGIAQVLVGQPFDIVKVVCLSISLFVSSFPSHCEPTVVFQLILNYFKKIDAFFLSFSGHFQNP